MMWLRKYFYFYCTTIVSLVVLAGIYSSYCKVYVPSVFGYSQIDNDNKYVVDGKKVFVYDMDLYLLKPGDSVISYVCDCGEHNGTVFLEHYHSNYYILLISSICLFLIGFGLYKSRGGTNSSYSKIFFSICALTAIVISNTPGGNLHAIDISVGFALRIINTLSILVLLALCASFIHRVYTFTPNFRKVLVVSIISIVILNIKQLHFLVSELSVILLTVLSFLYVLFPLKDSTPKLRSQLKLATFFLIVLVGAIYSMALYYWSTQEIDTELFWLVDCNIHAVFLVTLLLMFYMFFTSTLKYLQRRRKITTFSISNILLIPIVVSVFAWVHLNTGFSGLAYLIVPIFGYRLYNSSTADAGDISTLEE